MTDDEYLSKPYQGGRMPHYPGYVRTKGGLPLLCDLPEPEAKMRKEETDDIVVRASLKDIDRYTKSGNKKTFGQLYDDWVEAGRPSAYHS